MTEEVTAQTDMTIQLEEARVLDHLAELAHGSVVEALNAMLQKAAGELCHARPFERKAEYVSTRTGTGERRLGTEAGEEFRAIAGEAMSCAWRDSEVYAGKVYAGNASATSSSATRGGSRCRGRPPPPQSCGPFRESLEALRA